MEKARKKISSLDTLRKGKREGSNWQIGKTLVGCLDHIRNCERMTDIVIVFPGQGKNGVSINAHKLILAARSPVFENMFFGAESKKNRYFEETDIPPAAFKELLKYIYTDTADLTSENVLQVLNASEKYKIPSLTDQCSKHLIPILSSDTVCGVLETACNFGLLELQMRCFVYIDQNASEVLLTEGFKNLSRSVMAKIIKRRTLDAPELDVYKAVVCWAELEMKREKIEMSAENKRKTIGEQFSLLRIPCIPQSQFADHVVKDNLLSADEVLQIFLNYTASENKPLKFATGVPRSPGLIRAYRFTSFRELTTTDKGPLTGSLSMESNETIIILGFQIKGFKFKHLFEVCPMNKVDGTVTVSCGKFVETITIAVENPNASEKMPIEEIFFDKPVLLKKEQVCEMKFEVTFSRDSKELRQQEKDTQLIYSVGQKLKDCVQIDDLEIKYSKPSGGALQWITAFILSPF